MGHVRGRVALYLGPVALGRVGHGPRPLDLVRREEEVVQKPVWTQRHDREATPLGEGLDPVVGAPFGRKGDGGGQHCAMVGYAKEHRA